ncbi:hypothetical protein DQ04_01911030 [Trypanosoma grayi]|uniref:hypothetical protein n=1 Tax=Trypanosoma grayi TaxID=71804 RepID=UPI0004F4407F|nr:hypothetical protein DQ04_01911030 [Trypanosoma grayi]KEG12191.1 hypothetical protein DQ04_01911030 [Trypanosoma grayi]
MQSSDHHWEPGVASSGHGASLLTRSFLAHIVGTDARIGSAATTTTMTASTQCPSSVQSLFTGTSSSTSTDTATTAVGGEDAGTLFQEKIRLLKKSMQDQRALREQQQQQQLQRERDAREVKDAVHNLQTGCAVLPSNDRGDNDWHRALNSGSSNTININRDITTESSFIQSIVPPRAWRRVAESGEAEEVCRTPIKGVTVQSTADDASDASGATASPVVVVVASPPLPVVHCDAATMTVDASPTARLRMNSDENTASVSVANTNKYDRCTDAPCREVDRKGLGGKKPMNQGDEPVTAAANLKRRVNPPDCQSTRNRHCLTSPLADAGVGLAATVNESSVNASRDAAVQVGTVRRPKAPRRREAEIRTLRAPSERCSSSSSSRLSSLHQDTRATGSEAMLLPSDTKTMWAQSEDDDDDEPAPRRPTRRTARLSEKEVEQLVMRRHGPHAVLVGSCSASSETHAEENTTEVLRRRGVSRSHVVPLEEAKHELTTLHRRSPSLAHKWVKEDIEAVTKATLAPTTRPSNGSTRNNQQKSQRREAGDESALLRQRRCLLRQIKLIDAEIHRMGQVPWSKTLRSGTGTSTALEREKAKLVALRKQYETELEQVVTFGERPVTPSLLPPSLPLQHPRATSVPRRGPSVYEAVLQQQPKQPVSTKRPSMAGKTLQQCGANGGRTLSKRSAPLGKGGNNSLPPRVQHPEKATSRSQFSFSSAPCTGSCSHNELGGPLGPHANINRSGSRRSISLDAERMASLYLRSASSSRRCGTPLGNGESLTMTCDNSAAESSDVPLYWRVAQMKRDTEAHSENRGDTSNCWLDCESASPSPNRVSPPLPSRGRVKRFDDSWCEAELCSDVLADQYYCAEYGEEECVGKDESKLATQQPSSAAEVAHRNSDRRSLSVSLPLRQQSQQLQKAQVQMPRARSGSRTGVKIAGAVSSDKKAGKKHSNLCYRLRAPTPQEASNRGESKQLYFRADPTTYKARTETPMHNVVPRRLGREAQLNAYLQHEEGCRRNMATSCTPARWQAAYAPPLSHLLVKKKRLQQEDSSMFVNNSGSFFSRTSRSASAPPPSTQFGEKPRRAAGRHPSPFSPVPHQLKDTVDWTSPPRSLRSSQMVERTPPPAHHSSSCHREKHGGLSPPPTVYRDPKEESKLRVKQQQQRRQLDFSPQLSEVHVSPLTEYSGGGSSPMGATSCGAVAGQPRPTESTERESESRQVVMRRRTLSSSMGVSPPSPLREIAAARRSSTNVLSTPLRTTPSPLKSKPQRHLGDDRTNELYPSSSRSAAAPQTTRRVGAGGITLRQLFGHEQKPLLRSPGNGLERGGCSSTDVLLDRICEMRAQMK